MTLTAMRPVLYRSVQYEVGDGLPADNPVMVGAWLEAGSAVWKDEDEKTEAPPKAKRATAPPGTTGLSSDGDPDARVGRIPERHEKRQVPKKGAKR